MKKCNLDCEYQHEGYCIADVVIGLNPNECTAKTNNDLISPDELEEYGISDW